MLRKVHVPLGSDQLLLGNAPEVDEDDSLLPLVHLTPTTLLGGTIPERETAGQLLAVQLSSMISARKKDEGRTVVCGLGLRSAEFDQQSYLELVELVGKCL
jgi:proteasome assembly chaperone 3